MMYRRTFLNTALSGSGYHCLLGINKGGSRRQSFHNTVDELIDAADDLDVGGYNAYFSLATFQDDKSRKVSNVKHLKSLFLDLDCGEGKEFKTQKEAITRLDEFRSVYSLPAPTLVNSGRGVHVYWILTEAVPYTDWFHVAQRLKEVCIENKFGADPSVTADAARVLRVPDTHNYKPDTPVDVYIYNQDTDIAPIDFETFAALLGTEPVAPPLLVSTTNIEIGSLMQHLMGNKESLFKDIAKRSLMGNGCAQLTNIIKNQAEIDEPLWRAGISIAAHCSDRDTAIHKISSKHPDYSAQETERKASEVKGPYLCDSFNDLNPELCKGCPHKGKIKSPIVLGSKLRESEVVDNIYKVDIPTNGGTVDTVQAPALSLPNAPMTQYQIPKYPFPYVRGVNGGVYRRERDADGNVEDVLVCQYDFYVVQRTYDAVSGESIIIRIHFPKDGVREFCMEITQASSREEFRKLVSKHGVFLASTNDLMRYTMEWVNELQQNKKADEAHSTFGWSGKNFDTFILGNQKFTPSGVEFNPPSAGTQQMFKFFEPKGTLDGWKKTMSIWQDPKFVIQQYALGIGFGSVLMELVNVNSAAVHFYSKESGVGKTAMLLAMASIWGDGERLVLGKDDTTAFKMNRCETYHSLPMLVDEITNMSPRDASEMVYQFTNGNQRGRMSANSNAERERGAPWSLMVATTGNTSILEIIASGKADPKAEAQRVLECKVPRIFTDSADKNITDDFSRGVLNNYGHAGPLLIDYIMHNTSAVRTMISDVVKKVDAAAHLTSENRFWSAQVACTLVALTLTKKLGLHNFDTKVIYKWAIHNLIHSNQVNLAGMASTALEYMNEFLTTHKGKILQIASSDKYGQKDVEQLNLQVPEEDAKYELVARYETDTQMFFVKTTALKEWAAERQIPYNDLIEELKLTASADIRRIRLTSGTKLRLPAASVVAMKFTLDEEE